MPHDPQKYLYDALEAARLIDTFTHGKSLADYTVDPLLRSAVERQLITLGEALGHLARRSPEVAERIENLRRVVAFRNVIVHGYDIVENETVWDVVRRHLPPLAASLASLLEELDAREG
ncbi:MAG: DUF86 domain-containing protein [Nitrospinae bacterium]|nr:DUF86 domain-containing protein [Nitrospinota bacterium]